MEKKWWILGIFLILTGCGGQSDGVQEALDFRTALLSSQSCQYQAEVTANLGKQSYDFTLDCTYAPQEPSAHIQVLAPEEIGDIEATVTGEGSQLEFADSVLELGTSLSNQLSPLLLPKILGDSWKNGYIQTVSQQEDHQIVEYCLSWNEDITVYTHFDGDNIPYYSEVYDGKDCILMATIKEFAMAET